MITFTLHPDIVGVIRSIAKEENIPLSVVADEAALCRIKKAGTFGLGPPGMHNGPTPS